MSSTRAYWERVCHCLLSFVPRDLAWIAIGYADDSSPGISEMVDAVRKRADVILASDEMSEIARVSALQTAYCAWLGLCTTTCGYMWPKEIEKVLRVNATTRVLVIDYVHQGIKDWDRFASLLTERQENPQCLFMAQDSEFSVKSDRGQSAFLRFVRVTQCRVLVLRDRRPTFLDLQCTGAFARGTAGQLDVPLPVAWQKGPSAPSGRAQQQTSPRHVLALTCTGSSLQVPCSIHCNFCTRDDRNNVTRRTRHTRPFVRRLSFTLRVRENATKDAAGSRNTSADPQSSCLDRGGLGPGASTTSRRRLVGEERQWHPLR